MAVCSSGDAGNRSESSACGYTMIDYLCVWLTHEATRHSLIFLPPKFTVHTPWCVVVRERCESISGCVPASNWWCVSNSLLLMMRTQLRPTSHENMASSYFIAKIKFRKREIMLRNVKKPVFWTIKMLRWDVICMAIKHICPHNANAIKTFYFAVFFFPQMHLTVSLV